jgi:hypothetical protein
MIQRWQVHSFRLLAVFLLGALLVGAGIAAAHHDCSDTSRHHSDHCGLCSLASSAAETSPVCDLPHVEPQTVSPVVQPAFLAGFVLPSSCAPRAPPSL